MVALVDCNNFYASCERVFRPDLAHCPILVLSNNDGCVVARSKESKALGIEMAVPIFSIRDLIKKHQVAVFSSNYTLYGDMSQRVMATLATLVPRLEVYSIDEAFLDLSGYQELDSYGKKIRERVRKWTGIPVSVGIAPTKTLAKIANHQAKAQVSAQGTFVLKNKDLIEQVLKKTPVSKVWGIGQGNTQRLENQGVFNAWQLANLPDNWVRKNLTVIGLRTVKELRGEPCLEIEEIPPTKKMVITSLSFERVTDDYEVLKEYVASFASKCAEKLRKQKARAGLLTLSISTNKFNPRVPQYKGSKTLQFLEPTNLSPEIIRLGLQALAELYKPSYKYKKANVTLTHLVPEDQIQTHLFAQASKIPHPKQEKAMRVLDQINQKIGPQKVKFAVQGVDDKWRTHQEKLSPCYTTRWKDFLSIQI